MKIKPGENLTDKIFYSRKIPEIRYLEIKEYNTSVWVKYMYM